MKKIFAVLIVCILLVLYLSYINIYKQIPHYKKHLGSSNHIVAHRGFSSLEYENSYESIKLANKSNCVDAIEIDVRLTNDGYLVLSHNDKLILSKNNKIKISKIKYHDFMRIKLRKPIEYKKTDNIKNYKELEIKDNVGSVASLYQVLKIVNKKTLIIDIKYNKNIKKLNKVLLNIVKNKKNVILQSSDINAINDMKKINSKLKYQYIINTADDIYNITNDLYGVSIRYNLINYTIVNDFINRGIHVFVWTINDTKLYKQIIEVVKENSSKLYYVTDYPDILCNYDITKFREL